jgi:hypothetical protein
MVQIDIGITAEVISSLIRSRDEVKVDGSYSDLAMVAVEESQG